VAERTDVAVIGAGLVGLATAHRLLESRPGLRVTVLEAAAGVGTSQSSRNSGVVHAGLYYTPGSAKALLTARGRAQLLAFCREAGIDVRVNGKLVVAVDRGELPRLHDLEERAAANGVEVHRLGPAGLRSIEPAVTGVAGLHVPSTAVVDFAAVSAELARRIRANGGAVRCSTRVEAIGDVFGGALVTTTTGQIQARAVVACAGLQADRLAGSQDPRLRRHLRIVPFRGSWLRLRPGLGHLIRGNIYPVPAPGLPFLGVHLTRRFDDEIWIGPNAVLALARMGARPGSLDLRDLGEALGFVGTWNVARRHLLTGIDELWRDRVLSATMREVRRYVPGLTTRDVTRGPWGVRAQAVRRDGSLVDDFVFAARGRAIHVLNAPSPAATASLAIGERIRDRVLTLLDRDA
jgi:(S)-2-hydroxyglutarate dehydrogenase